jgi:hypothetical protein
MQHSFPSTGTIKDTTIRSSRHVRHPVRVPNFPSSWYPGRMRGPHNSKFAFPTVEFKFSSSDSEAIHSCMEKKRRHLEFGTRGSCECAARRRFELAIGEGKKKHTPCHRAKAHWQEMHRVNRNLNAGQLGRVAHIRNASPGSITRDQCSCKSRSIRLGEQARHRARRRTR